MKAPQTATAEDQPLVQFQGMIAEYERAQILERSRRAASRTPRTGQLLSGVPASTAIVMFAKVMTQRVVYNQYVRTGTSIGAITRLLNERGVPTSRKQIYKL